MASCRPYRCVLLIQCLRPPAECTARAAGMRSTVACLKLGLLEKLLRALLILLRTRQELHALSSASEETVAPPKIAAHLFVLLRLLVQLEVASDVLFLR